MSAKQYFAKVLQQIYESQQGFTVQTSIYLKKIDQYLFSSKALQNVKTADAQLLYFGDPDKKHQGLFEIAGTKTTFGGLKKSSYYALQIIEKTVTKGKNKQTFIKVFTQCDQQDFKTLRLATHISAAKYTSALQLCAILKSKRPYLSQSDYIFSEDARKVFIQWYESEHKKKKTKGNITEKKSILQPSQNQTSKEPAINFKANPLLLIEGMMKLVSIETDLQELQFYQDYIMDEEQQYLIDTFLDPIDVLNDRQRSQEQREIVLFKRFMYFIVETPVTKVARSAIEKYIFSIHMESQEFNPQVLVNQYHKKLNDSQKTALSKTIPMHFGLQYKRNLTKYFFDNLIELSKSVNQVKENFVQNQTIKNDASVGFSLRTQMKHSMKNLCDKVQPLSRRYEQSQKLRKLIVFLQSNPEFVKLPMLIKKLLDQRNTKAIVSLYKKYQILIEAYKNTPIIKGITAQIEQVLASARMSQIQIAIQKNYDMEQLSILVGLFANKSESLVDYIVPKLVYNLIQQIDSDNRSQAVVNMEKKVQKYQIINFKKCDNDKSRQKINIDQTNFQDQGDGLVEFLEKIHKQKSIIEKGIQFKDKIKQKFKNFFEIKKKWALQYNCYFFELKFLIQAMTSWYSQMIKQIISQKAYELVYVTSQMLIIAEKNAQDPTLLQSIGKLKQSNFQVYCTMITEKTRSISQFKKCPIRKDADGNYFNDYTVNILDNIVENVKDILKFPSFAYKEFYILRLYKYFQQCLMVEQNKIINLPELFTYSAMVACVIQSKITLPFYTQLEQFKTLKEHLQAYLKKCNKKIESLLYSIIKIEYRSTINKHKKEGDFGFPILEYFNECCYLITEYASINYKNHSRFIIEGFQHIANEASSQILKQNYGKVFVRELQLIRAMTNKINSKKITAKWDHLLKMTALQAQEISQKNVYILENKHKFSNNFCGLMEY